MVDAKAIKDKVSKKADSRSKGSSHLTAHKHCQICGVTIDIKAEPRICKADECLSKHEKRGKNDRMMRIMFFIFVLIFFAPILLSAMGFGIAG
jgi:predicted nucleic acid-binding Zn ribbon protein